MLLRALTALAVAAAAGALLAGQEPATEVRAIWVQRGAITSPIAIRALVKSARSAGFNTLVVQVRGRGDAFYDSGVEPRAAALSTQPLTFDPLSEVLAVAHDAGLRVHAWMNVNLVSDSNPPASAAHVVRTHPEWLMVPREIAADDGGLKPGSAAFVARLSAYARAHADRIEGLYLSPLQPAAADYTVSVISDLAARYPVDGIHLDYIRFPNAEFDYGPAAITQFRAYLGRWLTPAERGDYDARARREPLFYTRMFPQRWQDFRREQLTALVRRLRTSINAKRPGTVLSAAVVPDGDAAARRFQDWSGWLDERLIDVVCPMAYTTDPELFRTQIAAVERTAGPGAVWAGIGAFQLTPQQTVTNIFSARRLGAEGVILFSYDNLIPRSPDTEPYLATVGRDAFGR